LIYGISSYSAFIRVANPGDPLNNLYLDITVNTFPGNIDPIDSLQVLFNNWGGCGATSVQSFSKQNHVNVYPNPSGNQLKIETVNDVEEVRIINASGNEVKNISFTGKLLTVETNHWNAGLYFVKILFKNGEILTAKFVKE